VYHACSVVVNASLFFSFWGDVAADGNARIFYSAVAFIICRLNRVAFILMCLEKSNQSGFQGVGFNFNFRRRRSQP